MNILANQKNILCYGDSNTWGYIPSSDFSFPIGRYKRNERWTGVLQILLGKEYYIIEEGLNSRTTNIDYFCAPDRNGKTYLPSCLYSHAPLDLVVLALGANDAKTYFHRTPKDITAGLEELIDIIQSSFYSGGMTKAPRVLIVPPSIPLAMVENYTDEHGVFFLSGSIKKLEKISKLFYKLSQEKGCEYLDTRDIIPSKIDGVHYGLEMHQMLAQKLAKKIQDIFINETE